MNGAFTCRYVAFEAQPDKLSPHQPCRGFHAQVGKAAEGIENEALPVHRHHGAQLASPNVENWRGFSVTKHHLL